MLFYTLYDSKIQLFDEQTGKDLIRFREAVYEFEELMKGDLEKNRNQIIKYAKEIKEINAKYEGDYEALPLMQMLQLVHYNNDKEAIDQAYYVLYLSLAGEIEAEVAREGQSFLKKRTPTTRIACRGS